jgi:cytochrome c553
VSVLVAAALLAVALPAAAPAAAQGAAELVSGTLAITPDAEHGKILYLKHCARCHGAHAWGDGPREIPTLAGQRERYLIEQLARFATNERPGSEMHGPAMFESLQPPDVNRPQALGDLAAWLSRAARNPQPDRPEESTHAHGERIYTRVCSACHGGDGGGRESGTIPAIGAQHYEYLRTQLRGLAAGLRRHPPGVVKSLSPEEQQAVADYASTLTYLSTDGSL